MKHQQKKNIWLPSLIIALPLFIITLLLEPIDFAKFQFEVTSSMINEGRINNRVVYQDLDGDGYSERIVIQNDGYSKAACFMVYSKDNRLFGQINLRGSVSKIANNIIAGQIYDGAFHDLAVVTRHRDSLFLNIVDLSIGSKKVFETIYPKVIFLDKIRKNRSQGYDFHCKFQLRDTNHDGSNELFVSIVAGHSITPRRLYKFDTKTGQLYKSATDGNCGNLRLMFADLNRDGVEEAIGGSYAPWNIGDTTQCTFHDQNAYVMVFDSTLDFFFPPIIQYGGYKNFLPNVVETKTGPLLVTLNATRTDCISHQTLKLFSAQGIEITRLKLPMSKIADNYVFEHYTVDSTIHIIDRYNSQKLEYSNKLELTNRTELSGAISGYRHIDLFGDGCLSTLYCNPSDGIFTIAMKDKKLYPIEGVPSFSSAISEYSVKLNGVGNPSQICIFENKREHLITVTENSYYILKIPFYLSVICILFFFIYLVFYVQSRMISKRFEERERLKDLELASAYNQLDPHFTFNVLNAIGYFILDGQKEEAYEYFVNLSELIRMTLENAKDSARSLKDELAFVKQYLEIEKFRFIDKLSFEIKESPNVDYQVKIPKMLIHIFIENALKHGISTKTEGGHISIVVSLNKIIIEDNGIGRQAAKLIDTNSIGKGVSVMDEYILLFNKQLNRNISYHIDDLMNVDGQPNGTRVTINLGD